MKKNTQRKDEVIAWLIGLGVFLPMFFTISGGLYRTSQTMTDSGGLILTLPWPLSIMTCGIALLYYFPRLRAANASIWTFLTMSAVLIASYLVFGDNGIKSDRKLLMAVQVILPFIGLFLGQVLDDYNNSIAKSFMLVLFLVVPLQLAGSLMNSPWSEGNLLSDQVGFFTIYGHIQFVTLIFVCAFSYSVSQLYDQFKLGSIFLCILMFFYVLKSWSYLTIGAYSFFILSMVVSRNKFTKRNIFYGMIILTAIVSTAISLSRSFEEVDGKKGVMWHYAGSTYNKLKPLLNGQMPQNVKERFEDWERFGSGILESPQHLLLGHAQPMPREVRSSAHNWYIDTTYTFGVIGILPVLGLFFYTARLCWLRCRSLPLRTWWLVGVVFYLIVIDSNFKVTLRQPYPGIFAFFMWGLLLTRLQEIKQKSPY